MMPWYSDAAMYPRCDKTGHFARECPEGDPEEREVGLEDS